ncbi:MAG: DUF177 domain-containing protein [Acidobacteria bacterium]|nr:DUF177 domain-containing protein [Acidobacteriota bacterium]
MFLDLSHMRGTRDRVDRVYEPAALDPEGDAYRVIDPVRLAFDVVKEHGRVRLQGTVSTVLELVCSRCLEAYRLPVDVAFDLMYLPQRDNVGEGEIEVDDEDLGTAFYRDDTIDVGGLMREQFYLSLPMKPLCVDACRGLCPACGTNLNTGTCACAPQWTDPRLDALRTLTGPGGRDVTH